METVNQEVNEPAEKTFTQDEVNAIIAERLKRDRGERADYDELKAKAAKLDEIEEANKTELQKANERAESLQKELNAIKTAQTLRDIRDKVSGETGVPVNLLTGSTEEECRAQADSINAFARPKAYPNVKDAGEASYTPKATTRDKFAEWFNSNT